LMPPLALRHLKYAAAARPDELKLSGPVTLTIPPMITGSPAAALPLLSPHLALSAWAWPPDIIPASVTAASVNNTVFCRMVVLPLDDIWLILLPDRSLLPRD